jgi:outer membrane receptor protein involved in Fe transport
MKISYKTVIQTTVALASLCIGSQAFAADAPEDEANAGNANDIIVSARRIEERLQDVPISVAVVNQDQLTKANISSADELVRIIPGLNVESRYSSETNAFAIRGFNQALRTTSSVGTYFGEVVAPRGGAGAFPGGDGAGPGSLFDLQNVQVLKGPQGTLFGRNTTGGAVLLTPKKPTDQLEGYVQGSYGNYNMFQIQAVLNLPLASWARLRLGVDRQTRDGTQNNVSGIGPAKLNDVDYYALRGSLVLDLSPDIENYTIVSYSDSDHVGTQPQLYRANSASAFGNDLLAGAQVARLLASNDPYQVENNMVNPRSVTKQFQVINTTKWQVSDNITFRSIRVSSGVTGPDRLTLLPSLGQALPDPHRVDLLLSCPAASIHVCRLPRHSTPRANTATISVRSPKSFRYRDTRVTAGCNIRAGSITSIRPLALPLTTFRSRPARFASTRLIQAWPPCAASAISEVRSTSRSIRSNTSTWPLMLRRLTQRPIS